MEKDFHDELCRRADFSLRLSEKITSIDKDMAVIRNLKKLSGGSGFGKELFVNLEFDDLADLTLKLATQLNDVRSILKDSRTILEDVEPLVPCPVIVDNTPQLISDIGELKSQLNELVLSKPVPLDYSRIAKEIAKPVTDAFRPFQAQPAVNSQKQAREVADIQARSCNLMIYNCVIHPHDAKDDPTEEDAKEVAKTYLGSCNVPSIEQYQERVADAVFVNKSENGRSCTLRVVMDNQWIVNAILKDARLMKDSIAEAGSWGDHHVYKWKDSYINKDRTVAEREERRILVTEQKEKIASEPTKRWVIKFGRVFAEGAFVSKS